MNCGQNRLQGLNIGEKRCFKSRSIADFGRVGFDFCCAIVFQRYVRILRISLFYFNPEKRNIQIFDAKFIILTTKNCIRNHCKQIETVLYLIIVFEILLKACGLGRNRPDSASLVLQEETL